MTITKHQVAQPRDEAPQPTVRFSTFAEAQYVNNVLYGDAAEVLARLPSESVSTVVTSPPYFQQRDYETDDARGIGSERTVHGYIEALMPTFRECARVLRTDGSVFFNLGDKYEDGSLLLIPWHFARRAAVETGLKLINQITWVKPNPQPRQFKRRLVPATEPIFHFVKSDAYKYFPDRFLEGEKYTRPTRDYRHGRVGEGYIRLIERSTLNVKEKQQARKELEVAIREVRQGKIWSFRMKIRGIHSAAYGGYEGGRKLHIENKGFTILRMFDRPMKRDVIETPIIQDKFLNHPAMFPTTLVRECLSLTTEPDDLVLDPFLGSGTTAVTAKEMGRRWCGIDLNADYCKLARRRIADTKAQPTLFQFVV